jgi:hypothetical protein
MAREPKSFSFTVTASEMTHEPTTIYLPVGRGMTEPPSVLLSTGFFHRRNILKVVRRVMREVGLHQIDFLDYADPFPAEPTTVPIVISQADAFLTIIDTQYVMTRIKIRSKQIDREFEEAVRAGVPIGLLVRERNRSAPKSVDDRLKMTVQRFQELHSRSGSPGALMVRWIPESAALYGQEIRSLIVSMSLTLKSENNLDIADPLRSIPDQSPAPVCVEERSGRIVLVNNRDSALSATEADFNGWREPVVDHIQELLSGDFREGTNHSRARDRLVALATYFVGSISEVKEQQFRVGYEIERFGGLVSAYRSSGEDMPTLSADVLEDIDRLRIALAMGVSKLERWAEFHRAAATDPAHDGDANPALVSEGLDELAGEMERRPAYFDPELPETFRFLAEATRDPRGATKTVVYGGVRSAENLVSFLGRKALGIGANAVGAVEQNISKAIAATLIAGLSGTALQISGALPTAWAWLRPLLDALARGGNG